MELLLSHVFREWLMITVDCPKCGHRYKVADELAGKSVHCPDCNGKMAVRVPGSKSQMPRLLAIGVTLIIVGVLSAAFWWNPFKRPAQPTGQAGAVPITQPAATPAAATSQPPAPDKPH